MSAPSQQQISLTIYIVFTIIHKSLEMRTENTGFDGIELQSVVDLDFLPTKRSQPKTFFRTGNSPLKIFPPER